MESLYQDSISLGAGGIGLPAHKNAYKSSVLIANWVEDKALEKDDVYRPFYKGSGFLDHGVPFVKSTTSQDTYRCSLMRPQRFLATSVSPHVTR